MEMEISSTTLKGRLVPNAVITWTRATFRPFESLISIHFLYCKHLYQLHYAKLPIYEYKATYLWLYLWASSLKLCLFFVNPQTLTTFSLNILSTQYVIKAKYIYTL